MNKTFQLGGALKINRLGFGAMRITGKGVWGQPTNKSDAINVLKKVLELGINFIDTADSYGPYVSEELIAEVLYPYPDDLVIATKGGWLRPGQNEWTENGRPEHLRKALEGSLKRLRVDRIDLYQYHTIDPHITIEDSIGTLADLQKEGKIRFIGVSNFKVNDIQKALNIVPIISVQNRYSLIHRIDEPVVKFCEENNIAYIPWYPLEVGRILKENYITNMAKKYSATSSQIALAWLLKRSPVIIPIPGTSSVTHLEENWKSWKIQLSDIDFKDLEKKSK